MVEILWVEFILLLVDISATAPLTGAHWKNYSNFMSVLVIIN